MLGFAITRGDVLLILKNRPDWQAGKLNGVGGKVEDYDLGPYAAMIREFYEETGIETNPGQWHEFGAHIRPSKHDGDTGAYKLHLFVTKLTDQQADQLQKTKTDETADWFPLTELVDLSSIGVPGVMAYIATAVHSLNRPNFYTTTIES